jgi:hypothetical protein
MTSNTAVDCATGANVPKKLTDDDQWECRAPPATHFDQPIETDQREEHPASPYENTSL